MAFLVHIKVEIFSMAVNNPVHANARKKV